MLASLAISSKELQTDNPAITLVPVLFVSFRWRTTFNIYVRSIEDSTCPNDKLDNIMQE